MTPEETARHERLLAWRAAEAKAAGAPAFTILPDVTLRALAQCRPTSLRELAAVRGIGPVKITRFGAALIEVLTRSPLFGPE
jgi:ATP-dependent DNA helicase RecQ